MPLISIPTEKINNTFHKFGRFVVKFKLPIIVLMVAIFALGVYGLTRLKIQVTIESFFLEDDPVMVDKREFEKVFGNNDFVGVLVEAEDVFNFETVKLIRELGIDIKTSIDSNLISMGYKPITGEIMSLTEFSYTASNGTVLDISDIKLSRIEGVVDSIRDLFDKRKTLRGKLYSEDYKQTWIIIRLDKYPDTTKWTQKEEPAMYIGKIVLDVIKKYEKEGYRLTPAGVPPYSYQKNVEMFEDMRRVLIIAAAIALIFMIIMIRSPAGIIGTTLVMGSAIVCVFGAMGLLGIAADTTFMLVPMLLTIAVSIGYTIHITAFFKRQFKKTGDRKESVAYAVGESGWPILFTAATTIFALSSFALVPIKTMRWVGFASAASIFVVYLILMFFYVAVLSLGRNKEPDAEYVKTGVDNVEKAFENFSIWVIKHGKIIVVVFAACLVALVIGFTQIKVDLNVRKMMGVRLPHVKNLVRLGESAVGAMYSYDLTISMDKDKLLNPEVLQKLEGLSEEIKSAPLIKRTTSLVSIIRDYNQAMHGDDEAYFTVPDSSAEIDRIISNYVKTAGEDFYNWINRDYTTLRISVDVADFSAGKFQEHMDMIENRLAQLFPKDEYPSFSYSLVGSLLQMSTMNQYVTKGQIQSFGFALIMVAIMMIIVFGGFRLGLIAMLPNIAPAIVAGGLMGFMGVPLEFVTMTIAPMVLGLAVDNTIHIINHTKLEYERTGDYDIAIRKTFMSVGKAITQASIILCVTFVAFTTSKVNNMINMGIFTIAGLLAALIADLFVTPTLIRLTKPFKKRV